jgi:hypothetical protein
VTGTALTQRYRRKEGRRIQIMTATITATAITMIAPMI